MGAFSEQHVRDWREQGFTLIEDFFRPEEIAPVRAEYERIYGLPGESRRAAVSEALRGAREEAGTPDFRADQFRNIDQFPYLGSAELNMLSLHPSLIKLSKALLDVPEVHMYQSHTWAKYTGETNYDQAFHCDFGNHTLLIPSDEVALRTVDFIVYLTDVTDAHGALHYVTKPDSNRVLRDGAVFAAEESQQALLDVQQSAAGKAGTLVAHSIDTFHRGTNLTEPNGHRFTMTVGYKAAGNEMIGYQVWQQAENRPWHIIFEQGSPEQMSCLGVPLPGDAFWTARTLKLSQSRWPDWDMNEYFAAAGVQRNS